MLEGLMQLTVYGPDICTDQCDDLITSSVKNWLQTKYSSESCQVGIKPLLKVMKLHALSCCDTPTHST
jgi:hypothetical protein